MARAKATTATKANQEMDGPPEPVAPWNWSSIPDYGPLKHYQHAAAFFIIGLSMTAIYEYTTYFSLISRDLAYPLIWVFIFLRMLGKLGPAELTPEEELEQKEKEEAARFKATLQQIADEVDDDDDEEGEDEQNDKTAVDLAKKTQ
ncbi:hypothetical protein AeMF1_019168 [Aphanomyces euteiches]|nr:hypothetical protein AeMF1_019168 [Aphanomyces euteiches]KAH9185049.1 hypothetical protein AeNC1_012975 [Aphanomyces euteiches]